MPRSHYVASGLAAASLAVAARLKRLDTPESGEQALNITAKGPVGASTSTGGVLRIDNTLSSGVGINVYSNAGATASGNPVTGRLVTIRADNSAFPTQALYVENDGASHAVMIVNRSTTNASNALGVVSENVADTALGVRGRESGRGTVKITHEKPDGVADGNASAISIVLGKVNSGDTASAAQGIFLDSDHTTTGRLIQTRQNGSEVWTIGPTGYMDMREQTDPAAPAANFARMFTRDNGSGKTQLCVRFATGAVQVISTEP
jgi:hypothetical protein